MPDNGPVAAPFDDSRLALARWLADPASTAAQRSAEAAIAQAPRDPIAAASRLRSGQPHLTATQASAVLEQTDLRRLADERYGFDAGRLLLTRDGLEQATRPDVAGHRAHLIRAGGARHVVDLTAGLGFDTAAFLAAGLAVTCVERDPVIATFLAHNCPRANVLTADATDASLVDGLIGSLESEDVVFADPARRDPSGARGANLRARPERDPSRWSPAWPFIESLPHPRIAAKVAPSMRIPAGWRAEWTSVQRTVVDCAVYSWPAFAAPRRALVWSDGRSTVIDADDTTLPSAADVVGAWLHEPDPAIVRAGAVAAFAARRTGLRSLSRDSTWLTSDAELSNDTARSFEVIEQLSGSVTDQRRQLDRLGVGALTVKSRNVDVAPATARRELGRGEGTGHVLIITRLGTRTIRLLCSPARSRSS